MREHASKGLLGMTYIGGDPAPRMMADVLTFAREKIAVLTGMPADAIKLDLKMGV